MESTDEPINSCPADEYNVKITMEAHGYINVGATAAETYSTVAKYALRVLHEERELFKELNDNLKLFKTTPSYSVAPFSANPKPDGLRASLRRLTDVICKEKGMVEPTKEELQEVIYFHLFSAFFIYIRN